jgi:hypothetical protein
MEIVIAITSASDRVENQSQNVLVAGKHEKRIYFTGVEGWRRFKEGPFWNWRLRKAEEK